MRGLVGLAMLLMVSSCATIPEGKSLPLRVGVTPNYPPLIQLQGEKAAGIECDFAVQLAGELKRPLQLVTVPWELQFDQLQAGEIDIIMSGVTVTPARQARAAFCDPYMENPLIAVTRRGESARYVSAEDVIGSGGGMGVLKGTSADTFVRRKSKNAKILPLSSRDDVVFYLANQRIDLYIDDLAAAVDIVSRNESRLELVGIPLAPQKLAWAVRSDNDELRQQANEALARWRANGLREQILNRWLPYRQALIAALAK